MEDAETKEAKQEEEKKEDSTAKKGDRKRGKREKREKKAIINSDEDITEEQSEPSKIEQTLSEATVEEKGNVCRRQDSGEKQEYQEQEESDEDNPN